MKRIIALVTLLCSMNVFADDRILWLDDEICSIASNTSGIIATDVVKNGTMDTFNYDAVLQIMTWKAFNDLRSSEGIRRKQLTYTGVAFLYLRETQFSLHGSVKRAVAKYPGKTPAAMQKVRDIVAQETYDRCQNTVNFNMSPLTIPNPEGQASSDKGPKVRL